MPDQTSKLAARPDHNSLPGRRALITGASSGIGHEVARRLSRAGAAVVINYHSHAEPAEKLAAEISSRAAKPSPSAAMFPTNPRSKNYSKETLPALGGLDVVVTNSGLQKDAAIANMTLGDWNEVISVNLTGRFLCCREAIAVFRAQTNKPGAFSKGSIVCISSVHQVIPWPGHVNYAASNGGIPMMMQTLAQEVTGEQIRVNAVASGAVHTPISQEAWETPEALEKLLKLVPYGRIGEPDDVAWHGGKRSRGTG